jgi:hypothetical protein
MGSCEFGFLRKPAITTEKSEPSENAVRREKNMSVIAYLLVQETSAMGGNAVWRASKKVDLGPVGNTISGALGRDRRPSSWRSDPGLGERGNR